MKVSLNIGGRSIAIGTGLMIVLTSATLIRANGDDILDAKQTANLSVLARSERGDVINSKTLDNLLAEDRGPKQVKENAEGSQHATGLGTESGKTFHNSQPYQPARVWTIRSTAARRAAALRLTDIGGQLLRGGEYEKAVSNFEKALNVEANPYIYFYLAQVHYRLGHYRDALNFLEVAASWLMQQPNWAPQLVALKGQIPGSGVSLQVRPSVVLAAGQ
jgi:tetratricopeptide (TPR) repeat protein